MRKAIEYLLAAAITFALVTFAVRESRAKGYAEGYADGLNYTPPTMRMIDSLATKQYGYDKHAARYVVKGADSCQR